MITLRNGLITYGSCTAAAHLVGLVRSVAVDPFLRNPLNKSGLLASWVVGACVAALLAGFAAGMTVETTTPGRWAALLAVFAWLELAVGTGSHNFPDLPTFASATFWLAPACALLTLLCFYIARDRSLKRARLANAG